MTHAREVPVTERLTLVYGPEVTFRDHQGGMVSIPRQDFAILLNKAINGRLDWHRNTPDAPRP